MQDSESNLSKPEGQTPSPTLAESAGEDLTDIDRRSFRAVVSCLPWVVLVALGFTLALFLLFYEFDRPGLWGRLQTVMLLIFFGSSVKVGVEVAADLLSGENFRGHSAETSTTWAAFSREMKRSVPKGHALLQSYLLLAPVIPALLATGLFYWWSGIPLEIFREIGGRDIVFFTAYLISYLWRRRIWF